MEDIDSHMQKDINKFTLPTKQMLLDRILQIAEQRAEVYVSAELGMEDGEEKQERKNLYIEMFREQIQKSLAPNQW